MGAEGADATMGQGYINRFKNSGAYDEMIEEIESVGLKFAILDSNHVSASWTHNFYWYDVITVEWPYSLTYNFTFGTLEEVSAKVEFYIDWDLEYIEDDEEIILVGVPYLYYTADFTLRDNYNFQGSNNFLLRNFAFFLRWGTPYNAYGSFSISDRIRLPLKEEEDSQ